jgi:tetratricopeptide (TPR) repeat protein
MSKNDLTNPYITGQPITAPGNFYGRRDIVQDIFNRLRTTPEQNILVIHGQRRIGKTSLLYFLAHQAEKQFSREFIPVVVDLLGSKNTQRLFEEISDQITLALKRKRIKLDHIIESHTQSNKPRLQVILEKIHPLRVLLFIDEFDYLGDPSIFPNPADLVSLLEKIRTFVKEEKRIFFVFSIGRKLDQLTTFFQMLFKESPSIELKLLSKQETTALITNPVAEVFEYSEDSLNEIYKLTGGHPFITQALCSSVFDRMRYPERTRITNQDVLASVENALALSEAGLTWMWSALPIVERFITSALAELSNKEYPVRYQAVFELFQKFNIPLGTIEIMEGSRRLLATWDLLESGQTGFYRFKIEFIRLWVAQKHPVLSVLSDIENMNPRARRVLENAREAFLREDYENAVKDYQEAIALNEFLIQAYLGLSAAYMKLKDYKNAKEAATRAYERFPEQAAVEYQRAIIKLVEDYISKNQLDPALNELKVLFLIDPDHTDGKKLEAEIIVKRIAEFLDKKEWYFAAEKSLELQQNRGALKPGEIELKIFKVWDEYIETLARQKAWAELNDLYDQIEKQKIQISDFENRRKQNNRFRVYWDLNEAATDLLIGTKELADAFNYEIFNPDELDHFRTRFLEHLLEIIPVPKPDQPHSESIIRTDISDRFTTPYRQPGVKETDLAISEKTKIFMSVGYLFLLTVFIYFSVFLLIKYDVILKRVTDPFGVSFLLALTFLSVLVFIASQIILTQDKSLFRRELLIALGSMVLIVLLGIWGSWKMGQQGWLDFSLHWLLFNSLLGFIIWLLVKYRWKSVIICI